jgi:hypothetical protein
MYSADFTASPSLARRAKVSTKATIGKPKWHEKRATSKPPLRGERFGEVETTSNADNPLGMGHGARKWLANWVRNPPCVRAEKRPSAPSSFSIGVAELARVQILGILANSATPKLSVEEPLA